MFKIIHWIVWVYIYDYELYNILYVFVWVCVLGRDQKNVRGDIETGNWRGAQEEKTQNGV